MIAACVQVTLGLLIAVPNGVFLAALRRWRCRLATRQLHLLMANLAAADILFGLAFTFKFVAIIVHLQR